MTGGSIRLLDAILHLLCAIILLTDCSSGENKRFQKRQTSIIPYPRVGRSDISFMEDKRNGPGLIPFPRVGRSGPYLIDTDGLHKRGQNTLIPYPRVGRSSWYVVPSHDDGASEQQLWEAIDSLENKPEAVFEIHEGIKKRNENNGGGMWFGPRLGRKKRSLYTNEETMDNEENSDRSSSKGRSPRYASQLE